MIDKHPLRLHSDGFSFLNGELRLVELHLNLKLIVACFHSMLAATIHPIVTAIVSVCPNYTYFKCSIISLAVKEAIL